MPPSAQYLLWLLIASILVWNTIADPTGFVSINCGGEDTIDNNTIHWTSDINSNYIDGYGNNASIRNELINQSSLSKPLTTLRYFPWISDRIKTSRSCYNFTVNNGTSYIVRASFLYGNYDNLNSPPTFALLLNYDVWVATVTTKLTEVVTEEIMYLSSMHTLSVCVASTNKNNTPFISTLELRPLNGSVYYTPTSGALLSGYGLQVVHRINYGANSTQTVRYPDDQFDRIWESNTTGTKLTTDQTKIIKNVASDADLAPAKVMATAIVTPNDSPQYNLSFNFPELSGSGGFRINLHFAELLAGFTTRTINLDIIGQGSSVIVLNTTFVSRKVSVDQQIALEPYLQIVLSSAAGVNSSSVGPLLNALELMTWTPNALATSGTYQSDYNAIHNVQKAYNLESYGDGDPCSPKGYRWTWITCSNDSTPLIIGLNLSNFNLIGPIAESITRLSSLKTIDLSNNMLNGTIPDLSSLTSLQFLYLQNNSLSGELPSSLTSLAVLNVDNNNLCGDATSFLQITNFTYAGNANLCTSSNCVCRSTNASSKSNKTIKYIIVISILAALYIITVLGMVLYCKRQKKKRFVVIDPKRKGNEEMKDILFATQNFTYEEIREATNDFTTKIGEGGFGPVYKGILNGQVVAVKSLSDASKQGFKAFSTEVSILSRVRHKNLVSLLGFCTEQQYMLIYEYVSKGNLRDLLHGDIDYDEKPLKWERRLQIALDASQGLEYLHSGCDPIIIHRDVKSSNILLNENMQAKVSDFGLSRLKSTDIDVTHVSTMNVVGTVGYLDPEYNKTNQLTDKSDVYSFGVVLLELICGRPAIDVFDSPPHIIDWVKSTARKGNVGDVIDQNLANQYKKSSVLKMVDIALGCVETDKGKRPSMAEVVNVIKEVIQIEAENLPESTDVSSSSITSENRPNTLRYLENIRLHVEPR